MGIHRDLITRVTGRRETPVRNTKAHYVLKWSKKSTSSCWNALKSASNAGKGSITLKKRKINNPNHLVQAEAVINLIKNSYDLFKEQKKGNKILHKKKALLEKAKACKKLANQAREATPSNPELAEHYDAQAAILMQMRQRINHTDSIVRRINLFAAVSSGVTATVATIGDLSALIAVSAVSALGAASAGIGVVVPAALFFGYGTYKLALYTNTHAKANYWECTLNALETHKNNPSALEDSELCAALEKKMLKKGLIGADDPNKYEKMRAHAFNQCLQRKKSFAIEYIKQSLLAEQEPGKSNTTATPISTFLREQLGVDAEAMDRLQTNILPLKKWEKRWDENLSKLVDQRLSHKAAPPSPEEVKSATKILKEKAATVQQLRDEALDKFIGNYLGF